MNQTQILFQGEMVRGIIARIKTQTRRAWKDQPPAGVRVGYVPGQTVCPYGQPGDQLLVRETFYAFGRWETRYSATKGRDEWHFIDMTLESGKSYLYAADEVLPDDKPQKRVRGGVVPSWWKRPAIFMPRVAVRITLEILAVRVERLNDISEADAIAEGVRRFDDIPVGPIGSGFAHIREPERWSAFNPMDTDHCVATARYAYGELWESINGPGSWDVNPWVWVVEFKRVKL